MSSGTTKSFRQGQLNLFPSLDKQLRARTGEHALVRPDDEIAWREHLASTSIIPEVDPHDVPIIPARDR